MPEPGPNWETVTFAGSIFDIEAVKRAAYRFNDRIAVDIQQDEAGINCRLHLLVSGSDPELLGQISKEFRNEVIDQDLRIRIATETEPYRNLILSLAFSKTPFGNE